MKLIAIILSLILLGLAYVGAVQVCRYLNERYTKLMVLWGKLKKVIAEPSEEEPTRSPVITIKVHHSPPPVKPDVLPAEIMEPVKTEVSYEPLEEEPIPQEAPTYITLEMDGEEYNLNESITVEELVQMGQTLSVQTAPIKDEVAAARTICKLRDSPLIDALMSGQHKDRFNGLLVNAIANDPKIIKEGYDYSQFITR